jgi:hypothetical protein
MLKISENSKPKNSVTLINYPKILPNHEGNVVVLRDVSRLVLSSTVLVQNAGNSDMC